MNSEEDQKLIILTSDEPWGDVWLPQLIFAYELSKKYKVIFVNPPSGWDLSNLFSKAKPSTYYNPNLKIFFYRNIFPVVVFHKLFTAINDYYNSFRLKKEINHGKEEILLWQFDTYRFWNFPGIKYFKKIYHVIDYYLWKPEDKMFSMSADLVISTSLKYLDHYKKYNKNVLFVPHGITRKDQEPDTDFVNKIKSEIGEYILCLGSISEQIDLNILDKLSDECSGYILLLIGPVSIKEPVRHSKFLEICRKPNVKYLGTKHGLEIKNYVAASTVCIVPYDRIVDTPKFNRSPLRTLNYLAQYKPIVVSVDSEIPQLEQKAIYTSKTTNGFIEYVKEALQGKLTVDKQAVDNYFSRIEYSYLIESIMKSLNE